MAPFLENLLFVKLKCDSLGRKKTKPHKKLPNPKTIKQKAPQSFPKTINENYTIVNT